MYDPYEDNRLMNEIAMLSREALEHEFVNLLIKHKQLQLKYQNFASEVSWERTARQQERSGGWM